MAVLLEAKGLTTSFYTYEGTVQALKDFSLAVNHGETFGLVGESGCGKSVTVRSMMRIIQAPGKIEAGRVLFHEQPGSLGVDLLALTEKQMQAVRGDSISMVFQEPNAALNPVMTIGEQVSESYLFHCFEDMSRAIIERLAGPEASLFSRVRAIPYRMAKGNPRHRLLRFLSRIPILKRWDRELKREALRRSIRIIGQLGIANPEEIVTRYPHNLSGGMKQRIVIAIALACDPVLLIADEATSNLDVTVQAQILELLKELIRTTISSVLLITHDLGVVAETCDRVGVMYAGNLCEVAEVKPLFRKPLHPYTKALLDSIPKMEQEDRLRSIEGSVPNLVSPPPGCRFHPRCPEAMDICRQEPPQLKEIEPGRMVACHLYRSDVSTI